MDGGTERGLQLIEDHVMLPKAALVILKNRKNQGAVQLFDVQGGLLVNGRTLSKQNTAMVRNALDADLTPSFSGIVPWNIVYLSGTTMAFTVPAGWQWLFLGNEGSSTKVKRWIPDMLFVYSGPVHKLNAFWQNGGKFTPAPMPNIGEHGSVCLGTSMKRAAFEPNIGNMMKKVKTAFFGSLFNEWRNEDMGAIMKACEHGYPAKKFWALPIMKKWTNEHPWQTIEQAVEVSTGRTLGY